VVGGGGVLGSDIDADGERIFSDLRLDSPEFSPSWMSAAAAAAGVGAVSASTATSTLSPSAKPFASR